MTGATELMPWEAVDRSCPDEVKRFVYQRREEERAASLPHVHPQLGRQQTVQGFDSPHQFGDHLSYDLLTRGPLYQMTCHFTEIPPRAPVRGVHRHVNAPTFFCVRGKGWEWNDGVTYTFEQYDVLLVPPYTVHQHGGDEEVGCELYVPEAWRTDHLLGLIWREQHKLSARPVFREGTEPLRDAEGRLIGYRIKAGVLGVPRDIDVLLGTDPDREAVFRARRSATWEGPVANTYDRYCKLLYDEVRFCHRVPHVVREREQPWEWTRHGRLKWLVHPETETATNEMWLYLQEIPAGSRSGRHRHVAEELILVLEGQGYDVHDGTRWEWKAGDLICIPPMTAHQHFALGQRPALLVSAMPSIYMDLGLGGIEQLEDAPEYAEAAEEAEA